MTTEEAREKHCPFWGFRCIARDCMMWRWNDQGIKNEGYCGLAGKEE
jgi:hypothetical protein